MTKPFVVNDGNFDEAVLKAKTPVLVDFWAPWCAPCRTMSPIVDELAKEYDGRIGFGKLNTDENPTVSQRYNIRGIPTLLLFRNGKPVDQVVGLRTKADLKKHLDEALIKS
jgi:thioredoxin 1